MEQIKFEKQDICFIADIHACFPIVLNRIKETLKDCVLIVCGDIGFGFNSKYDDYYTLKIWNEELRKLNIHAIMFRGNHDNKEWFNGGIEYDYIKLIDDYTIITVGETNVLCVGGAISIDRQYRISHFKSNLKFFMDMFNTDETKLGDVVRPSYWENEKPIYDEEKLNEITASGINIDIIATHTSPSFCFKTNTKGIEGWLKKDEYLANDLEAERKVFDNIFNKVFHQDKHNIKLWVYGHFHEHWEDTIIHNRKENKEEETHHTIKYVALTNADAKLDIWKY